MVKKIVWNVWRSCPSLGSREKAETNQKNLKIQSRINCFLETNRPIIMWLKEKRLS